MKPKFSGLFSRYNRNILRELIRANFKIRDYNTVLGVLWSLIGSVVTLLVFYFIFRERLGAGIKAYPLYLLTGVVCVNFFITATTYMIPIFFVNRELVLNSTVPREIILVSALAVHVYKFLFELLLCLVLSIFYGCLTVKFFFLVLPLLVAFIAFVLGINMILSLVYCFAGDIEHIWMLTTRLFYFITPVFYTANKLSHAARVAVSYINPLSPFVISFQNIFLGKADAVIYLYSLLIGACFFIIGYRAFLAIENTAIEAA